MPVDRGAEEIGERRSTLRRATRRGRTCPAAARQRCYRDQSQNPLNEDAASRALARPTGLRASFTAAARAFQSSCRSSRQKESLPASLRRELALRTVFGGDESTRPSLAPFRVTALSGVAPGTSALAGASGRALQSSVRSSRQKESLPVSLRRELALRTVFGGDGSTRPSLAPVRVTALSGVARGTSALTGAAGRALQSSVRSSRQKGSLSMSSRRVLAVRTVFCTFFFGGDELATASLAPGRTPAFSGATAGTSLPAGAAFEACVDSGVSAGGAAAAGASLRPKGSRAIAGLSIALPDPHHAWFGGDGGFRRGGRRGCLAGSLNGHLGGGLRPCGCAGLILGTGGARVRATGGACIRARAAAGVTLSRGCVRGRCGTRSFGDLHRCAVRMAKGDDT